jgi:hypothetical protein
MTLKLPDGVEAVTDDGRRARRVMTARPDCEVFYDFRGVENPLDAWLDGTIAGDAWVDESGRRIPPEDVMIVRRVG